MDYLTEQDIESIKSRCSLTSLGDDYVNQHQRDVSRNVSKFVEDCRHGLDCSTLTEWMHHGVQFIMQGDDPVPQKLRSPRRIVGIGAEGGDLEGEIILGSVQENPKPSYHWLRELTEVQIAVALREHKAHLKDDAEYAEYCKRAGQTLCPWGDKELVLLLSLIHI